MHIAPADWPFMIYVEIGQWGSVQLEPRARCMMTARGDQVERLTLEP
eukprot:COSAG02_NODE_8683_length_2480_cov_2.912222_2_plen_47_part_00